MQGWNLFGRFVLNLENGAFKDFKKGSVLVVCQDDLSHELRIRNCSSSNPFRNNLFGYISAILFVPRKKNKFWSWEKILTSITSSVLFEVVSQTLIIYKLCKSKLWDTFSFFINGLEWIQTQSCDSVDFKNFFALYSILFITDLRYLTLIEFRVLFQWQRTSLFFQEDSIKCWRIIW